MSDCREECLEQDGSDKELAEEMDAEAEDLIEQHSEQPFDLEELTYLAEALLFASGEPVALERLAEVSCVAPEEMQAALNLLAEKTVASRGIELVRVADKYQLRTKAQYSRFIKVLAQVKAKRLSPAALETLSIVAYRQPVVRSDIEKIRGVDATPTIKTLLERRLIRIVGHQATVGQPALYGTTEEFLKLFGLSSLSELPSLRDLAELEADPGEIEEQAELELGSEGDQVQLLEC